ncbi:16S rRNA pseudouridine516 synthase [Luteimonas sp. J16]|jgi:16S rRNA pseudouridine516 synthase|uniref:pseudouridine synthase n=1 Tax=unclassified Luteimonas TaxID=2629088 RepID=UPI000479F6AC|nr:MULTISPECIES: 16S rRNA pseudouridine(516) synthase [unclassified Luteimonas]TWG89756.1 16S rRNA pseudouridine516 synthase [Luteimonas sp. J16]
MKLLRLLANLGYGSRREVLAMFREGRVTDADGEVLYADDRVEHARVRLDGEPLDPAPGMVLMLHKPVGHTCSTKDAGRLVYDLLPPRFRLRNPVLSTVGRLDRDTSGLLLMTDDGQLLHRIISPRSNLPKTYEAELAAPLRGDEAALFASGTLVLESEDTPLRPAVLEAIAPTRARLTVTEGRYHQVRRMFAAVGNHVQALHRSRIGGLDLGDLAPGQWRLLEAGDLARLFGAEHA